MQHPDDGVHTAMTDVSVSGEICLSRPCEDRPWQQLAQGHDEHLVEGRIVTWMTWLISRRQSMPLSEPFYTVQRERE